MYWALSGPTLSFYGRPVPARKYRPPRPLFNFRAAAPGRAGIMAGIKTQSHSRVHGCTRGPRPVRIQLRSRGGTLPSSAAGSRLIGRAARTGGPRGAGGAGMGINHLKSLVPGQQIDAWQHLGCYQQTKSRRVAVDVANILFKACTAHAWQCFDGDLTGAMAEFRARLEQMLAINLDFVLIFDGGKYEAKINEDIRRAASREAGRYKYRSI
eukprot:SAG31_NODE_15123_length_769_cov_1.511940_1_plen_211_part_00